MAPAFYCMVYTKDGAFPDPTQGIAVKTSPVPINPIFYTNIKSVNYLPNVLCQMDAEDAGYDQVCCRRDVFMAAPECALVPGPGNGGLAEGLSCAVTA